MPFNNDWGPTPQLDVLDHIVGVNDTPVADQTAYDQALIDAQARGENRVRITAERVPDPNSQPLRHPAIERAVSV